MGEMVKDYYSILNVTPDSSMSEIKKSYRKLVLKYHPDVNKDPYAEEVFKTITKAFHVLSNPKSRLKYDITLEKEYGINTIKTDLKSIINSINLKLKKGGIKNFHKEEIKLKVDDTTLNLPLHELGNRLLESTNPSVKKVAAYALVNNKSKGGYTYILNAIKNEKDVNLLTFYVKLIKNKYGKRPVYDLMFLKKHNSRDVKLAYIELISFNKCLKGVAILKEFLSDSDSNVRLAALELLHQQDPKLLLEKVYDLLKDPVKEIRLRAREILKELKKIYS